MAGMTEQDRFAEPEEMEGDITNEQGTGQVVPAAPSFENPGANTTEAPTPVGQPETEDVGEEENEEGEQEEERKENPAIREIRNKMLKEERLRKKAQKENELLRKQLEERNSSKEEELKKPDPEQYTDLAKYVEDLAEYNAEKKTREREKTTKEKERERLVEQEAHDWEEKVRSAKKKYKDFDNTLSSVHDMEVPPHIERELKQSDYGADILYYLAKHPDIASELADLSPRNAARKLLELEIQIEKGAKKPAHKKLSSAPAPSTPLQASTATGDKAVEDMDMDEYRAARKSGKIK